MEKCRLFYRIDLFKVISNHLKKFWIGKKILFTSAWWNIVGIDIGICLYGWLEAYSVNVIVIILSSLKDMDVILELSQRSYFSRLVFQFAFIRFSFIIVFTSFYSLRLFEVGSLPFRFDIAIFISWFLICELFLQNLMNLY
jgi:hypothetical protein